MKVELKPVDKSNWLECVELEVDESQKGFVASNAFSLAQAAYEDNTYPFAIYRDGCMTGFIMYDFDTEIGGMWGMCRLMVDKRFQKQGIGKAAVQKLLEIVADKHGHVEFYTSIEPNNTVAAKLYERLGFVRNVRVIYGEEMLVKQL